MFIVIRDVENECGRVKEESMREGHRECRQTRRKAEAGGQEQARVGEGMP